MALEGKRRGKRSSTTLEVRREIGTPSAAVDIPGRACARIFILRENRCSTAAMFRPLTKRNWAKRLYDDGRNIEDDDYGASRACNPFNVATLT
ncbi:hypothetical protein ALC60_05680 [Trachymyrmex zeteki]|uniref:Uncharacterized protein n=1 Tax=Mycetomoellerius zeteki TaxID=64791 RepID=A0A151X4U1_9HYME|nr:hypothetical protein ALC60_05680 [Trachymyrmex zeteki]